jgi:uncharacterized membrane protein YqiK
MFENVALVLVIFSVIIGISLIAFSVSLYKKTKEGEALLISGARGKRVTFSGTVVIPVLEKRNSLI